MLNSQAPCEPLVITEDLSHYSRSQLNSLKDKSSVYTLEPGSSLDFNSAPTSLFNQKVEHQEQHNEVIVTRNELKLMRRKLIKKYKCVKQMTIDYYCREELVLTSLKEFFEIFISSLYKEQAFHAELMDNKYKYVGLAMKFEKNSS